VDGFRLDALNHAMFDPGFADNPPAPEDGKPRTRPYDFQAKVNSMNHPDVVGFVERIAAVCHAAGQPLPWPKSAAMMPIR
jgi:alpha-glucosidase